jgi:hypothetical protein
MSAPEIALRVEDLPDRTPGRGQCPGTHDIWCDKFFWGAHRRFFVARQGGAGSTFLAKVLDSHPDVTCAHEGVLMQAYPKRHIEAADLERYYEWMLFDTAHEAYAAAGDVGSAWIEHLAASPDDPRLVTGFLNRHPVHMLNVKRTVYQTDRVDLAGIDRAAMAAVFPFEDRSLSDEQMLFLWTAFVWRRGVTMLGNISTWRRWPRRARR